MPTNARVIYPNSLHRTLASNTSTTTRLLQLAGIMQLQQACMRGLAGRGSHTRSASHLKSPARGFSSSAGVRAQAIQIAGARMCLHVCTAHCALCCCRRSDSCISFLCVSLCAQNTRHTSRRWQLCPAPSACRHSSRYNTC